MPVWHIYRVPFEIVIVPLVVDPHIGRDNLIFLVHVWVWKKERRKRDFNITMAGSSGATARIKEIILEKRITSKLLPVKIKV